MEEFRREYQRWRDKPFPVSVHGEDWGETEPALLDADLAGLIGRVLGGERLHPSDRRLVTSLLSDLEVLIARLPKDAQPYFEQLHRLGRLAIEEQSDS